VPFEVRGVVVWWEVVCDGEGMKLVRGSVVGVDRRDGGCSSYEIWRRWGADFRGGEIQYFGLSCGVDGVVVMWW